MSKIDRIKDDWRLFSTDDGREILTKVYLVDSLKESMKLAQIVVPLAERYNEDKEQTQLSLSSRDLMIILNGFSKKPISKNVRKLAAEIDKKIQEHYSKSNAVPRRLSL